MSNSVIVVGGGLAGLAAATALGGRGVAVTLLESRPRLGGRASSFLDQATGTWIDNCQHVSMGCCTNFEHFCRTVGIDQFFRREETLYFIAADGRVNRLSPSFLPAPLHFSLSFQRLSYLTQAEKLRLAAAMRSLAQARQLEMLRLPMSLWLEQQKQSPAAIERFWHVVLVSALSETLDRIDVAHARKVFVDAFLANRHGWEVRIPTVPLDELYGRELTDWLTAHGAQIRLQTGAERIELDNGRVARVVLRNGEELTAGHFILALPHHRVLALLPESLREHPQLAGIGQLESAPISSVHLWFDRPITELPHAVLIERLSQWVFNRSQLQTGRHNGQARSSTLPFDPSNSFYYQVVISASRDVTGQRQEETIATVVRELAEIWPAAGEAKLLHARQVTEHRAVFSVVPGVDELRPLQQSPLPNLQLAGDWTRTGWPATMEGAVRSGYVAAGNVLTHLGRPETVLQPDLPTGRLAKLLLGL